MTRKRLEVNHDVTTKVFVGVLLNEYLINVFSGITTCISYMLVVWQWWHNTIQRIDCLWAAPGCYLGIFWLGREAHLQTSHGVRDLLGERFILVDNVIIFIHYSSICPQPTCSLPLYLHGSDRGQWIELQPGPDPFSLWIPSHLHSFSVSFNIFRLTKPLSCNSCVYFVTKC